MNLLAGALLLSLAQADEHSVGRTAHLAEVVLPGPELEVAPFEFSSPLVVRRVAASPHGSDWRYDLEVMGLEPGTFDVTQFLRPANGAEPVPLPPVQVSFVTLLPPGQVEPHVPEAGAVPSFGGYRMVLVALGLLWFGGLVALMRMRRSSLPARVIQPQPKSAADRLRPLVERALKGELSSSERARLERLLFDLWRQRLHLQGRSPEDVLAVLKQHDEAGPLLRGLKEWLHKPRQDSEPDLEELLEPYRSMRPELLEPGGVA